MPTAVAMWREREILPPGEKNAESEIAHKKASGLLSGEYYDRVHERVVRYQVKHLGRGLGISFLAGNLSGLLGVGGGVFKVPGLRIFCGVPMRAAAATSNFMIGVTAAAGAFFYYGRGEVRPVLTAVISMGVLLGTRAGVYFAHNLRGKTARKVFAVLLVVVALEFMYRALRW